MKLKFQFPLPCWVNRSPEFFDEITMFDLSFQTTIHYFKNHDTSFSEVVVLLFGFGIRLQWGSYGDR